MPTLSLGQVHALPDAITVLPGTDVSALWKPFRFYEAGHHAMDIMNPLSPVGLEEVIDQMAVQPGERVLDIACGHGEALLRIAARQRVQGTGLDLSPWTLRRAQARIEAADVTDVQLVLGDGRSYIEQNGDGRWDIIILLGAPWIWGGFEPSVRALTPHLEPGGRLVIADVVATSVESRERLDELYGHPGTAEEQRAQLAAAGLCDQRQIPAGPRDWRDYDDRVLAGMGKWLETHPHDTSYMAEQTDYEQRRADGADVTWVVWIANPCPEDV